eukprot:13639052-Heterocapsa_arctica.AAC.1
MVPRGVLPESDGPRLTGSQELRRLFAVNPAQKLPLSLEEFPRLARARTAPLAQEEAAQPQEYPNL